MEDTGLTNYKSNRPHSNRQVA